MWLIPAAEHAFQATGMLLWVAVDEFPGWVETSIIYAPLTGLVYLAHRNGA